MSRSWGPSGLGTEEGASEHDRPLIESYGSGVASKVYSFGVTGRGGRYSARPGHRFVDLVGDQSRTLAGLQEVATLAAVVQGLL
jgi:hypothetical protein